MKLCVDFLIVKLLSKESFLGLSDTLEHSEIIWFNWFLFFQPSVSHIHYILGPQFQWTVDYLKKFIGRFVLKMVPLPRLHD